MLGRPLGIWRQAPGTTTCAKPYQGFGYHNTSFRGEGADDSRGILDCPAIRWRDLNGDGVFDETLNYLQDFRGDVIGLAAPKDGILEHVRYGPTGRPEAFPAADVNFDGVVDDDDQADIDAAIKAFKLDNGDYDPRADLNRDGKVDDDDGSLFLANAGAYKKLDNQWKLSQGSGLTPGHTGSEAGLDNRFGWRGYWYDRHLEQYQVRNRVYDPRQGQFLQTDPLGFGAGDQNLYRYADGQFSTGYDPYGLITWGDVGAFLKGAVKATVNVVVGTIVVGAVYTVAAAAAPILGTVVLVAATAYAAYEIGKTIYEIASGEEAYTQTPISREQRWERAGSTLVNIAAFGIGFKLAWGKGPTIQEAFSFSQPPPAVTTPAESAPGSSTCGGPRAFDPNTDMGAEPLPGEPPAPEPAPTTAPTPAPNQGVPALTEIQQLGPLQGQSRVQIGTTLQAKGFTRVTGMNGGEVWTKPGSDGNTAMVRIDPPMTRPTPRGFADEVPHVHKETVPTSSVINGNTPRGVRPTTYDDTGAPSSNPRDTHIPGGH
ncbi:MAG: RHS repeat-associated core domain-containing protein [Phycisphaerales bacterium]